MIEFLIILANVAAVVAFLFSCVCWKVGLDGPTDAVSGIFAVTSLLFGVPPIIFFLSELIYTFLYRS